MAFKTARILALAVAVSMLLHPAVLTVRAQRAGGAAPAAAAPAGISRIAKYATGVDNMEKTVAFYRDALGITLRAGATLGAPAALTAQLQAFAAVPAGAQFRSAFLSVPGALGSFDYELTEFTGVPRPPRVPSIQDPGASVLMLSVVDLDGMVAKVRKAGGIVVTPGSGIVTDTQPARGSLVQDPDGAFIALVQPNWAALAAKTGSATQPIGVARFGFVVADAEKAAAFYRDRLGLQRWAPETGAQAWGFFPSLAALAGLKSGVDVATVIQREGGTPIDFFSFPQGARTPFVRNTSDPGVPVVGLEVKDASVVAAAIAAGGGSIVSGGGKGAPGMNVVFTRDPSGILVEVIQTAGR